MQVLLEMFTMGVDQGIKQTLAVSDLWYSSFQDQLDICHQLNHPT
jgi:hypothetical protein